jgi:hypothetical protein
VDIKSGGGVFGITPKFQASAKPWDEWSVAFAGRTLKGTTGLLMVITNGFGTYGAVEWAAFFLAEDETEAVFSPLKQRAAAAAAAAVVAAPARAADALAPALAVFPAVGPPLRPLPLLCPRPRRFLPAFSPRPCPCCATPWPTRRPP